MIFYLRVNLKRTRYVEYKRVGMKISVELFIVLFIE